MENNLKNIWKSEINKSIKRYTDEELNGMVIKSARKAMKTIGATAILRIIIAAISIFLVWSITGGNDATSIKIIFFAALLIILVSYFLMERSTYKLNQHTLDAPVKDWLKYRIDTVEKSYKFKRKYDFLVYGGSFLLAYIFYLAFQIASGMRFNWVSLVILIALFGYFVIIRHFQNKNYNKTLQQLKALYRQLEEETL